MTKLRILWFDWCKTFFNITTTAALFTLQKSTWNTSSRFSVNDSCSELTLFISQKIIFQETRITREHPDKKSAARVELRQVSRWTRTHAAQTSKWMWTKCAGPRMNLHRQNIKRQITNLYFPAGDLGSDGFPAGFPGPDWSEADAVQPGSVNQSPPGTANRKWQH